LEESDRTGAEATTGAHRAQAPPLAATRRVRRRAPLSSQTAIAPACLPLGQGPAWRSGRPCAGGRRSPKRRSLIRRSGPRDKTGPAGIPASRAPARIFQRPRMTSAWPYFSARAAGASARLVAQRGALAGQCSDDALAHAWHVIEQRCDHSRSSRYRHRGAWKSVFSKLNDGIGREQVANSTCKGR